MGTLDALSRLHLYHAVLIVICLIAFSVACHPPRVVLLVPGPLAHDIGTWLDSDLICIGLPPRDALYVTRRCVPMKTIRALILQTRLAGLERPEIRP